MGCLWKRSMSPLASSWLIGEQLEDFRTWPHDWTGIRSWLDPIAVPLVAAVKLDFLEAGKLQPWHRWDIETQRVLKSERLKVSYHQFHLTWQHVIVEQHVKIISVDKRSLICSSQADLAGTKGSGSSLTPWLMLQIGDICPIIHLTGRLTASMLAMLQLWSKTNFKGHMIWWERVRQQTEETSKHHFTKNESSPLWAEGTTGTQTHAVYNGQLHQVEEYLLSINRQQQGRDYRCE